jgi:hypothetical protein
MQECETSAQTYDRCPHVVQFYPGSSCRMYIISILFAISFEKLHNKRSNGIKSGFPLAICSPE